MEQLFLQFPGCWGGEAVEEFLRGLVSSGVSLHFLFRLEIQGCFLPTHFLILSALDSLHLTELGLKFSGFLSSTSSSSKVPMHKTVKKFLQSQSNCLKRLTLEDVDSTSNFIFSFPKMDKLEKLKITGSCFGGTGLRFQGLNYSAQFPVLETLSLLRVGREELRSFVEEPVEAERCESLRKFKLKDSQLESSLHANVTMLFPNVQDLVHG